MSDKYVWSSFIREADVKNLPEQEILEMVSELIMAVQSICYAHGIHN